MKRAPTAAQQIILRRLRAGPATREQLKDAYPRYLSDDNLNQLLWQIRHELGVPIVRVYHYQLLPRR